MYSRVRATGRAKGMPCQPSITCGPDVPRPMMKRPPVSRVIVIAVIAAIAGVRAPTCMMPVPSRTFSVLPAR